MSAVQGRSVQCNERRVGRVGVHVTDCREVDAAFGNRLSNLADRFYLAPERPEPLEFFSAGLPHRIVMNGSKAANSRARISWRPLPSKAAGHKRWRRGQGKPASRRRRVSAPLCRRPASAGGSARINSGKPGL